MSQQIDGNFIAFIGSTSGFQATYGYFAEFTPDGEIIGRYQAPPLLYTDNHEILRTRTASGTETHLFSYDIREVDLTSIGGLPSARIAGHQILRFGPSGVVEFMWNAWDHFALEDWIEEPASDRQRDRWDFDHPNSLEIDLDGHYVASFRHLAEITKIDPRTGRVIWRLGGRNNQFTIVGDPLGGFSAQHSARILANGNLLLFDNGTRHQPPQSRAIEYALDTNAMTATMVWEYRHDPAIYARFTGSVQRLQNGNTVVGFVWIGTVNEVDPSGTSVWEGTNLKRSAPGCVHKIFRVSVTAFEAHSSPVKYSSSWLR